MKRLLLAAIFEKPQTSYNASYSPAKQQIKMLTIHYLITKEIIL